MATPALAGVHRARDDDVLDAKRHGAAATGPCHTRNVAAMTEILNLSPVIFCLSAALVSLSALAALGGNMRVLPCEDEIMWLGVVLLIGWASVGVFFVGVPGVGI